MKSNQEGVIYFFDQTSKRKTTKRARKVTNENSLNILNKKLNSKFQTAGDLLSDENELNPDKPIADRLAELSSLNLISGGKVNSAKQNPNAFTDTRLQAIKYLTDDMIEQLQEMLILYHEHNKVPQLHASIVYDLHSDWSDLTDKCRYTFPKWQTRYGRDLTYKRSSESVYKQSTTSSRNDNDESALSNREKENNSVLRKSNNSKLQRQGSKLNIITENKLSDTAQELSTTTPVQQKQNVRQVSVATYRGNNTSRLIHHANSSSGYSLSYQFSSNLFREKGWTVTTISVEEELINNDRKIVTCIKNSLRNIDEVRSFNEKNGLTYPCKVRFYGDHKKEQIEKYKNSHLKPKKSLFAMSIMRNEIPKPLNLNLMLESLSNPNLASLLQTGQFPLSSKLITTQSLQTPRKSSNPMSKSDDSTMSLLPSLGFNPPKPPPLLNTQTTDGTNCVFYPNGQIAVLIANVFGYTVENAPLTGANASTSTQDQPTARQSHSVLSNHHSTLNSVSGSTTTVHHHHHHQQQQQQNAASKETNVGLIFAPHIVKNSFTTVVYDTTYTDLLQRSAKSLRSMDGTSSESRLKSCSDSSFGQVPVLAVITSTGACVCYRKNGYPKFICNEQGGCLCNQKGAAYFQWKWDELLLTDYQKFQDDLLVDLNEYVRLEYKNPSNIKLKFTHNRETLEYDLNVVKENQAKINSLLAKCATDLPLKSKLGQSKISANTKSTSNLSYKQRHSPQQHLTQSFHKSSINLSQIGSEDGVRIDKIIESTVSFKDIPVMKDLLLIQKKIRSILEDWLNACRNSLGVSQPNFFILTDLHYKHKATRLNKNHSDFQKIVLHRRKSKSAEQLSLKNNSKSFEQNLKKYTSTLKNKSNSSLDSLKVQPRSKSAFYHRKYSRLDKQQMQVMERVKELRQNIEGRSNLLSKKLAPLSTTRQLSQNKTELTLIKPINREVSMRNSNLLLKQNTLLPNKFSFSNDLNLLCPVSLHNKLVHGKLDVECKCRRQTVPFLNDVEFDSLMKLLPVEQLAVVVVVDSYNSQEPKYIQVIVEQMYTNVNKNRLQPCKESLKDDFRFFYYDVRRACNGSDHLEPLLNTRHNISPGMVLIYKSGRLVFCDHIFNGYGYSQQDFLKQLNKSKMDAATGKFLPHNFRFNHPMGKVSRQTAWGDRVGGVEVELTEDDEKNYVSSEIIFDKQNEKSEMNVLKSSDSLLPKLIR